MRDVDDMKARIPTKAEALQLLQDIQASTHKLQTVLWSQAELMANKEFLNRANQKINDTIEQISHNLYWYQKVGWKRFAPDVSKLEREAAARSAAEEKSRFADWLNASTVGRSFYTGFHREVSVRCVGELLGSAVGADFRHNGSEQSVLEVGCRDGCLLRTLTQAGVKAERLSGVEVDPILFEEATTHMPAVRLVSDYPDALPFEDEEFDVVLVSCLLPFILDDALLHSVTAELRRVVAQQGSIVFIDPTQAQLEAAGPYVFYASRVIEEPLFQELFPECNTACETTETRRITVVKRQAFEDKAVQR